MKYINTVVKFFIGTCYIVLLFHQCSSEKIDVSTVELHPNGAHVCSHDVAYTALEQRTSYTTAEETYRTCCRRLLGICIKRCEKKRMIQRLYTKLVTVPKLRKVYFCCEGWEQEDGIKQECTQAICVNGCDIGECTSPNKCLFSYSSLMGFKNSVPAQCGGNVNAANSSIEIYGKDLDTFEAHICRWRINIPTEQETVLTFSHFQFNKTTSCARSFVTIEAEMSSFYCSILYPSSDLRIHVTQRTFVVEAVVSGWQLTDGFKFRFQPKQNK